jgi:hypothetical protein
MQIDRGRKISKLWQLRRRLEKCLGELTRQNQNPELKEELNSLSVEIEKLSERPNEKRFAIISQSLYKIEKSLRSSSQTLNSNQTVLQNGNGIQNDVNPASIEKIRKDLFAMRNTPWVRWEEDEVGDWIKRASLQDLLELKNDLENFLQRVYIKQRVHHYAFLKLSLRRNGKVGIIPSQNVGKSSKYRDEDVESDLKKLEELFAQIGKEGNYMPGFEFKVTDPDLRKKLADIIYLGRPPQTEHPLYLSVDRDRRVAETRYGGFTAYVVGDTFNQIMRIALGLENAPAEQVEARLREYQNGERIEIGKRYR